MKYLGVLVLVCFGLGCSNSYLKNYDSELDKALAVREEVGEAEFDAHKSEYTKDLRTAYNELGMSAEAVSTGNFHPSQIFPSSDERGNINGDHFQKGVFSLTFDDGPHPIYSHEIMTIMNEEKFPLTFFWLAENIAWFPKPVQELTTIKFLNHPLFYRGLHSYTHAHFSKLDAIGLHKEVVQAKEVFEKHIGEAPTLFRCPYGDCGHAARALIAKENMIHVMWNVDSLDWADHDPHSIFLRVKKQMILEGRGIILMHDIHPQTVEALKLVLAYIKTTDLKIESLKDIISETTGTELKSP